MNKASLALPRCLLISLPINRFIKHSDAPTLSLTCLIPRPEAREGVLGSYSSPFHRPSFKTLYLSSEFSLDGSRPLTNVATSASQRPTHHQPATDLQVRSAPRLEPYFNRRDSTSIRWIRFPRAELRWGLGAIPRDSQFRPHPSAPIIPRYTGMAGAGRPGKPHSDAQSPGIHRVQCACGEGHRETTNTHASACAQLRVRARGVARHDPRVRTVDADLGGAAGDRVEGNPADGAGVVHSAAACQDAGRGLGCGIGAIGDCEYTFHCLCCDASLAWTRPKRPRSPSTASTCTEEQCCSSPSSRSPPGRQTVPP